MNICSLMFHGYNMISDQLDLVLCPVADVSTASCNHLQASEEETPNVGEEEIELLLAKAINVN